MEAIRNISRIGRNTAGMTQARWAEALDVSVEAVAKYESGKIMPADDVVLSMAEVSGMQILCYWHMLNKSRVAAEVLPAVEAIPLPQAVVQLICRMRDFENKHRTDELLFISADGVVDESERPAFDQIVKELDGVVQAAMQVRFAPREELP